MKEVFAGVDWGCGSHAVCVLDAKGAVPGGFEARHDREGLAALTAQLRRHGAPPVAIERPTGLLVDHLVEAGLTVVPIHPNAVKACRPRHRAISAKSDPGDAARHRPRTDGGPWLARADVLRTDGHRLRPLEPQSDAIRALRALVRGRDDRLAARVALADPLTALLNGVGPRAAAVFADVAGPIAPAFLNRHPTPDSARRLGPARMAGFLAQRRPCGRRSPEALPERLRAAPTGHAGEAERKAKGEMVRALARTLHGLVEQLDPLTRRIEHTLASLPDGRLVMSFPRAGRVCAAARHGPRTNGEPWLALAELGDVRGRFQTDDPLAAEAGVAR